MLPDDDDARASAIEERIERLRKLNGWASDTRMVSTEQVEAVVEAMDGGINRSKAATSKLVLRWNDTKSELTEQHTDVGSGDACKVRVMDASVASRHCRISRDGDGFRVRDMNTKTGTWVNEERIPLSSALADGDELRCGDVIFNVQIAANATPTPTKQVTERPKDMSATVMTTAAALREAAAAFAKPKPGVQLPPAPSAPVARAPISGGRTPRTVSGQYKFSASGQAAPTARAAITGSAATCFVVYFDGEGTECEAEVPQDRPLVVGRRPTADLRMQDQGISSMHAAFEWAEGEFYVRDLGSTNGTWLHGERIGRAVLADQDIVRLGLVPVRVRFVEQEVAYEDDVDQEDPREDVDDEADVADEAPAPAPEEGPASWHLVYLTDSGSVTSITLNTRMSCVVAGEGKNEISVQGRGLKPEHLQFDWSSSKLEVIAARRDALLKVNGKPVTESALQGGDVVSAGTLFIRVVKASAVKSPAGGRGPEFDHWAGLFKAVNPDIELLFVDPDAATGGRTELSIWGDGSAQVEDHSGASSDRYAATLEPAFLKLLLGSIIQTGFPDLPSGSQRRAGARPELHAFCGNERAFAVLSDRLTTSAPPWREVRDLLRAVTSQILG